MHGPVHHASPGMQAKEGAGSSSLPGGAWCVAIFKVVTPFVYLQHRGPSAHAPRDDDDDSDDDDHF